MKKTLKVLIFAAVFLVLIVGVFLCVKLSKKWPNEVVYGADKFYTDEGVYYVRERAQLIFHDYETNTDIPVCSKPDCEHNSSDCNAYFDAFISKVMVYADKLYIQYCPRSEVDIRDGGEIFLGESPTIMEELNLDGSGRKKIYSSDYAVLLSMCAYEGKIYFTEYSYRDGGETPANEYYLDSTLYSYDINWNKTEELFNLPASDLNYNSTFEIVYYNKENNEIYMKGMHQDGTKEDKNMGNVYEKLFSYKDGKITDNILFEEDTSVSYHYFDNDKILVRIREDYYKFDDTEIKSQLIYMDYKGNILETVMVEASEESRMLDYGGFIMPIIDGANRLLYDIENDKWYVAKKLEKWIPDIVHIDVQNNKIFYDQTDYTGTPNGTVFTYIPAVFVSCDWDEFLTTYFDEYQGQEFDWIDIL